MSRPCAIVVGAGIAGLASAIALDQAGWSVKLFDRAPELRPAGAALSLWPNAMTALRRLGAAARIEAEAAPITRMRLGTRKGTALVDRHVEGAYLPTRSLLQAALLDRLGAVPLRLASEAAALVSADRPELRFADGMTRDADLLVVADGIGSPIARELLGTVPAHSGYTGVVALTDPLVGPGDGLAAEYWGRHERFGVCDVGAGRRYWFYMRTSAEGEVAPALADIRARTGGWPQDVEAAVAATPPERLIAWPIRAKRAPTRLGRGRTVCVGDAAHAMQPNLGQGACQVIEDAVALGVAARDGPDRVLARFEAMRFARVRAVVRRSAEGGRAVHGAVPVQVAMRAALRAMPAWLQERVVAGVQVMPAY